MRAFVVHRPRLAALILVVIRCLKMCGGGVDDVTTAALAGCFLWCAFIASFFFDIIGDKNITLPAALWPRALLDL